MDYPGRVLKLGESDAAVMKVVRQALRKLKYDVSNQGNMDSVLVNTVRLFQTRNVDQFGRNLVPDGEIGPLTWGTLFGVASKAVRRIDNALVKHAIEVARSQVGILEVPRNSNCGTDVEKYLASVNIAPGHAWCAAFVYWCMQEASSQLNVPNPCPRSAGVLAQWKKARTAGVDSTSAMDAKDNPKLVVPGMVFVIDYCGGLGHTGFVTSVQGALLSTLEGNTDASKTREGGGVYTLTRKVGEINMGYLLYR